MSGDNARCTPNVVLGDLLHIFLIECPRSPFDLILHWMTEDSYNQFS